MKGIKLFLGTLAILMLCATMAIAQSKSSKSKKKPSASDKKNARKEVKADESFWTTKMWYGADINYPALAPGFFNMGISPRIAYKMTNRLSAGVVLKTDYSWYRLDNSQGGPSKFENLDYGAGIFARARLFSGLYAQAEYEQSTFKTNPLIDLNTNKIITTKVSQPYAYLGLGWSSGFGKWQTQIGINRNLLDNDKSIRNLWDFKFGLAYNF